MRTAGLLIENLKKGLGLPTRHENSYLSEALKYEHELFTQSQIPNFVEQKINTSNLPCVLEIGCYYGKTTAEIAQENENFFVFGIDITYKRVVKTARLIHGKKLKNAATVLTSAEQLFPSLAENSLHGVCVFFPDPWPKKNQQKNRLLQLEFLKQIHGKLKHNGFFWFKTDSDLYLEFVAENLLLTKFVHEKEKMPNELKPAKYQSAFEALFETKKQPTHSLLMRAQHGHV
jgi:tRNA (guanine-N7-)-methyltransferase